MSVMMELAIYPRHDARVDAVANFLAFCYFDKLYEKGD